MSTKLHLRVEGGGRPLVLLAMPGQRHEVTQLERLLDAGAVKRSRPDGRPGRGRRIATRYDTQSMMAAVRSGSSV